MVPERVTREPQVRPATRDRRADIFRDAVRVIALRHAEDLTVASVARSIATSRRQLQRVLAEVGGTSFAALLQRYRVTTAAKLLAERPEEPIRAVAHDVGYRQPAQFSKTFRAYYAITPREFRALDQSARPRPGSSDRLDPDTARRSTGLSSAR